MEKPNHWGYAWTEQEDQILRDNCPISGAAAVAEMLGRTTRAVQFRARLINATGISRGPKPTQDMGCLASVREIELAYIAGFLDGDGWIRLRHKRHESHRNRTLVGAGQKSPEVLQWIRRKLGVGKVHDKGNGEMYTFAIYPILQQYALLRLIEPYLIVKKEDACKAIRQIEEDWPYHAPAIFELIFRFPNN